MCNDYEEQLIDINTLKIGTRFRVENGGFDSEIVEENGVKYAIAYGAPENCGVLKLEPEKKYEYYITMRV